MGFFLIIMLAFIFFLSKLKHVTPPLDGMSFSEYRKYQQAYSSKELCEKITGAEECEYKSDNSFLCIWEDCYKGKGWVYWKNMHERPTPSPNLDLSVSALPENLKWEVVNNNDRKANTLLWESASRQESGYVIIPGTEWSAIKTISEEKDLSLGDPKFLNKLSASNGWSHYLYNYPLGSKEYVLRDYIFYSTFSLNSLKENNYAYIKTAGNEIRIVSVWFTTSGGGYYQSGPHPVYNYPHEREYHIFISDILSIDELISGIIQTGQLVRGQDIVKELYSSQ